MIYLYEIGWICYDKLRNRNDDSDSDNLKQEWIIEKDGSTLRFESKYWTGEYLMGNLEYKGWKPWCNCDPCDEPGEYCRSFDLYWMYVAKDNPNWWKLIPADL